jgi:hypothetical protein
MSVQGVKGRQFFPLDKKLKLRGDQWSEGAARVAARCRRVPSSWRLTPTAMLLAAI